MPPIAGEGEQHDRNQQAADHQRAGEVIDRLLNEGRWAEDRGVDLHILKAGAKLIDSRLDIAGQLQRVAGGLLLDDQHDARAVIDNGIADRRREAIGHLCNIAHPNRRITRDLDDRVGKTLGGLDGTGLLHRQALVRCINKPAPADQNRIAGRRAQLGQRDARSLQPVGVGQNLKLAVAIAPHGDVSDARHRHQLGPDRPAHQLGQFHLVEFLRGDADFEGTTGG